MEDEISRVWRRAAQVLEEDGWNPQSLERMLRTWQPSTDVSVSPGSAGNPGLVEVDVDLPGVKKSDIHLELAENKLVVSGSRECSDNYKRAFGEPETDGATWRYREDRRSQIQGSFFFERRCGEFKRTVQLPKGTYNEADVKASFKRGVLSVRIPQPEGRTQAFKVNVD